MHEGPRGEGSLDRYLTWRAQESGVFTIIHNGPHLVHFDDHLTRGGIACAMSHRLALQALVEHPTADWALILEASMARSMQRKVLQERAPSR